MIAAILMVFLPAVLAGIFLLILGYRGRKIDDHPLCRKCRFDLSGSPGSSDRCPECGANVRGEKTTRVGNRQRRGTLLVAGWFVTIPSVLMIAAFLCLSAARIPLIHYEPLFMLKWDFENSAPATSDPALAEISRRIREGALGPADFAPIIDEILAWQADPGHRWNLDWGNLIEECSARSLLSKAQWERYLSHALGVRFLTNARVHRGISPDLVVQIQSQRFDSGPHAWATPIMQVDIDWALEVEGSKRKDTDKFDVIFDESRLKFIENSHFYSWWGEPATKPFSDGTHQIKVDYTLHFTYTDGTSGATRGTQSLTFQVVSPSIPLVNLRRDAAAISAMHNAIFFSEDSSTTKPPAAGPPDIRVPTAQPILGPAPANTQDVSMHQSNPPFRGMFTIELVQGDVHWPFRNVIAMAGDYGPTSSWLSLDREHTPATLPHPGPAEIVMTPEADILNPQSSYPLDGEVPPADTFGAELRFPVNLVSP